MSKLENDWNIWMPPEIQEIPPQEINRVLRVISGPYGTALKQIHPDFENPEAVLHQKKALESTIKVALQYLQNGASTLVSNTFSARNSLHQGESSELNHLLLATQIAISQAAISQSTRMGVSNIASLGPANPECYNIHTAPGIEEAQEFQDVQLAILEKLKVSALFETLASKDEAIGTALAAEKRGVPYILSFVIGRDGRLKTGESFGAAVRDIISMCPNAKFSLNCCPVEGLLPSIESMKDSNVLTRLAGYYPNSSSREPEEFDMSGGNVIHGLASPQQTAQYLVYISHYVDELLGAFLNPKNPKPGQVEFLGGCCATDGELIRHLRNDLGKGVSQRSMPPTDVNITPAIQDASENNNTCTECNSGCCSTH